MGRGCSVRGRRRKRSQNPFDVGMITRDRGGVAVEDTAAARDDERAALLLHVALRAALPQAGGGRTDRVPRDARIEEAPERALHPRETVDGEARVADAANRRREVHVLAKARGVLGAPAADEREHRTLRLDLRQRAAQLRRQLAAKNSAEVAQESDDGGALGVQIAEPQDHARVVDDGCVAEGVGNAVHARGLDRRHDAVKLPPRGRLRGP